MATQEIRDTNWQLFCEKFKELHAGTLVTVESIDGQGVSEIIAQGAQLRDLRLEKTDACSDLLILWMEDQNNADIVHRMVEPIHLKIRDEGGRKSLQIDAESGSTLIHFSSGKIPQVLEGIETV
ncbi:MAG: DUF5335 family protein [Verrucomicrobiota bacterium]|nr:DUF5335 family protein [Verrucomicrobiota bacterium]